jgi:hypothetical protein
MSASSDEAVRIERLEARITALERRVQTLIAAADAASRLRLAPGPEDPDVRITGGEWVRHILEKEGLVGDPAERGRA